MKKGNSYDTRFLLELFYTIETDTKKKIREVLLQSKPNVISTAALSEIYELIIKRSGTEVAEMRVKVLERDFQITPVDSRIALQAAQIRHKRPTPFADSLIAATSKVLGVPCYTDDDHFQGIEGLKVQWID